MFSTLDLVHAKIKLKQLQRFKLPSPISGKSLMRDKILGTIPTVEMEILDGDSPNLAVSHMPLQAVNTCL